MNILHISDLHVTGELQNLEQAWNAPSPHIKKHAPFDFIIVSGDLTQRAAEPEYIDLKKFAEKELFPLLTKKEIDRIVFVPGNHDIQWGTKILAPWSISEQEDWEAFRTEFSKFRASPHASNFRLTSSHLGHYALSRITEPQYRLRYENVNNFLKSFYGNSLNKKGGRCFDLTSDRSGEDWSAHIFPSEHVAFFGFNSCERNDKYWHGASISADAISGARTLADQLRGRDPSMLLVAVWHHGFVSARARPDRLLIEDLGTLYNVGFRVGFHGHTHEANSESIKIFDELFAVVSTGSLGAASDDRPDAVGNQFSIVRLYPSQARIAVHERDGSRNVYRVREERRVRFALPTTTAGPEHAEAAVHSREWHVSKRGVVETRVRLTKFKGSARTPLAVLSPPFCNVVSAPTAECSDGARPKVAGAWVDDGRYQCVLEAPADHAELKWSYTVSNAVAMDAVELDTLLPVRDEWHPNLDAGWDVRAHTVRFDCDELKLRLKFQDPIIVDAKPMVERRTGDGLADWKPFEVDLNRCDFAVDPDGKGASFSIRGPLVGARYGIKYKPREHRKTLEQPAHDIAKKLIKRCREFPSSIDLMKRLRDVIKKGIEQGIADTVPAEDRRDGAVWSCFLWHDEKRLLLPVAGEFAPQSWGARFAAGDGVAGHCFRFSSIAAWHSKASNENAVIYQDRTEHRKLYSSTYEWIVCFPIKMAPDDPLEPAIGVIGFAGKEGNSKFANEMSSLAHAACDGTRTRKQRETWRALETGINAAFWSCVSTLPHAGFEEFVPAMTSFAAKTAKKWGVKNPKPLKRTYRKSASGAGAIIGALVGSVSNIRDGRGSKNG